MIRRRIAKIRFQSRIEKQSIAKTKFKTLWRESRALMISSAILVSCLVVNINDPFGIDGAASTWTKHIISQFVTYYLSFTKPGTSDIVVGHFEDSYFNSRSQAPTPADYVMLIRKLSSFGAKEIVIDMNLRTKKDNLIADAIKHASREGVAVIVPYLWEPKVTDEDKECLTHHTEASDRIRQSSILCAATAVGAVQFHAEDGAVYYPVNVMLKDGETLIPSLAWAAYLAYVNRLDKPLDRSGWRDELLDDIFPVWRRSEFDNIPFCSFRVSQLLNGTDTDAGTAGCVYRDGIPRTDAEINVPIKGLVQGKIVLIGQSDKDNRDRVDTAFGEQQPGVMLHATVLDELLRLNGSYPVNRDDELWSWFNDEPIEFSDVYALLCVILPITFRTIGVVIAKFKPLNSVGEVFAKYPKWFGFGTSLICLVIFSCTFSRRLSTLNALPILLATYGIIPVVILIVSYCDEKLSPHPRDEKPDPHPQDKRLASHPH